MTIMNMSRSGQQKLSQFLFEYGSFMDGLRETPGTIRFNESDFEGCVILTVEEAKILLTMVDDFPKLSVANRLIKRLQERIEQAEKENASN